MASSGAAHGTVGGVGAAGVGAAGAAGSSASTSRFRVRRATYGDVALLVISNIAIAWDTEQIKLDPEVVTKGVERLFAEPVKGFYMIAELIDAASGEAKFAGSLMITYEWSDWRNADIWWMQSVFVQENFRGQGVYTLLYNEVLRLAKEGGASPNIRLYVEYDNELAKRCYEKNNMKQSHYLMYEADMTEQWN